MNYTDQELVQKTLDGDADSFSILVQRYQKQIYSLTYRLTNDPEDARDLAQEVFIHIFNVLGKYDQDRKFFSWMYKVATNVCYKALRRGKTEQAVALDKVIEITPLVAGRAQPEEYYGAVRPRSW